MTFSSGFDSIIPTITKKVDEIKGIFIIGLFYTLSLIITPYIGIIIGTLTVITRYAFDAGIHNLTMTYINKRIDSKHRATTISTFNMIQNLPYVFFAYAIGSAMDMFSAKWFAFILGTIYFAVLLLFFVSSVNIRKAFYRPKK